MPAKKKAVRRRGFRRKKSSRKKMFDVDVSALVGGLKMIDGLFGLDNIKNLDFDAMISEAKNSIKDPLKDGGLLDDAIDAGKVTMAMKGVNWIQKQFSGRNIGVTLGRVRIHL